MALTGRRPAEIFFSAKFSLPKKKLAWPALIFDGQLKTRNAPGTSFEPYPIPVLARPKTDHPRPRKAVGGSWTMFPLQLPHADPEPLKQCASHPAQLVPSIPARIDRASARLSATVPGLRVARIQKREI
jgi:hypothetical protein